jgi:tetratricopeptide (TPR) repeat protein
LNYNATANCKKYFEEGKIDRAKIFCTTAAKTNRDVIYYAAVAEYKYGTDRWAYSYLKEAEKYLLEKLETDDEQAKIEDKKKLAVVYLWLGEINKRTYDRQQGDMAENFGVEARDAAIDYFKKAIALTEELGDKGDIYIIARSGYMLGDIYRGCAVVSYSLLEEAEKYLDKALSVIEKVKPSLLFSKKDIQWTEMGVYYSKGIVQARKHAFKKATEESDKKGEAYLLKAVEIGKRIAPDDLPILKHNLAVIYYAMKDYDKYAKHTEEAIELEKKKGIKMNKEMLAEWYEELADTYAKYMNNKKRAIDCLDSAVQLYYDLAKLMGERGNEIKRLEYERKQRGLRGKIKKLYEEQGAN